MLPTVFFIGFMASGKTTLGKKYASRLNLHFVDLDREVASRYGFAKVQLLIQQHGIDAFRKAETETLRSIDLNGKLIATGGGTPCFNENLLWMKKNGLVVYVDIDEVTLTNRLLQTDAHERPLLAGVKTNEMPTFVHNMLQERIPYYHQAHLTIYPLRQKTDEIMDAIQKLMSA